MTVNILVERDQVVCDLRDALRDGASGLQYVPRLLKHVLETEAWRERYDRTSRKPVPFRTFAAFVTAQPTEGLGADVALIRRIVQSDPTTLDLLDRALVSQQGRRSDLVDNSNEVPKRPTGTSKEYALRRLRKDAPELHARVLAGELSPHAAMIEAGFRPPTFTVRADTADTVAATLRRRLAPEMLAEVRQILAD